MNYVVFLALVATLGTWFVTALGAATVAFFKSPNPKALNLMLGFASGVMIAASFWSLLQPAIERAETARLSGRYYRLSLRRPFYVDIRQSCLLCQSPRQQYTGTAERAAKSDYHAGAFDYAPQHPGRAGGRRRLRGSAKRQSYTRKPDGRGYYRNRNRSAKLPGRRRCLYSAPTRRLLQKKKLSLRPGFWSGGANRWCNRRYPCGLCRGNLTVCSLLCCRSHDFSRRPRTDS